MTTRALIVMARTRTLVNCMALNNTTIKTLICAFTLLLASACCRGKEGPPGDEGSVDWISQHDAVEGPTIDCGGEQTGSIKISVSGTTVRNCVVIGSIRVIGYNGARNGNSPALKESSRTLDHVRRIRNASPHHITIDNVTIIGEGMIPLYVGPGVTHVDITNSHIAGKSDSVMVYLDAETSLVRIANSTVDARLANREAIAIDASDWNTIVDNVVHLSRDGGIFAYRNCGEGGVIRHTTPSWNRIERNAFYGNGIAVFLGSRSGKKCYCDEDDGYQFGSSISDMDHARFNVVRGNKMSEGSTIIEGHARLNEIIR